jgi:hypothetical protein
LGHGGDPWDIGEDVPGERGGAGESKATLRTRITNPYNSDWANPPCSAGIPELTSLYPTDVHRGFGPTRVGQAGNGESLLQPTEGVSRVPTAEAAACEGGDSLPVHFIASPLHLTTCFWGSGSNGEGSGSFIEVSVSNS